MPLALPLALVVMMAQTREAVVEVEVEQRRAAVALILTEARLVARRLAEGAVLTEVLDSMRWVGEEAAEAVPKDCLSREVVVEVEEALRMVRSLLEAAAEEVVLTAGRLIFSLSAAAVVVSPGRCCLDPVSVLAVGVAFSDWPTDSVLLGLNLWRWVSAADHSLWVLEDQPLAVVEEVVQRQGAVAAQMACLFLNLNRMFGLRLRPCLCPLVSFSAWASRLRKGLLVGVLIPWLLPLSLSLPLPLLLHFLPCHCCSCSCSLRGQAVRVLLVVSFQALAVRRPRDHPLLISCRVLALIGHLFARTLVSCRFVCRPVRLPSTRMSACCSRHCILPCLPGFAASAVGLGISWGHVLGLWQPMLAVAQEDCCHQASAAGEEGRLLLLASEEGVVVAVEGQASLRR